jgi:APA family basic amino acid/polyamine antiporter
MNSRLFRTKAVGQEESSGVLARTYGLKDLLAVGIGGTVGSGVFVLTGLVANSLAGPWTPLCWGIAGVAALLSAASYAELSVRIPASGSSYNYVYATCGELAAYVSAYMLSLEFGVSSSAVARSWGDKLVTWLDETFSVSASVLSPGGVNITGGLIQAVCAAILYLGVRESKLTTNFFTVMKMVLVSFMIIAGFSAFQLSNLSIDDGTTTFLEDDVDSSGTYILEHDMT